MRSRSLLWSFNFAIEGIVYALRTQRNMRLHALAAVSVLLAAVILRVERLEVVTLLFAIALVFTAELVNTAIEAAMDVVTDRFDPLVKVAKDVAAGAVFIASLNAVAVGYFVFFAPATVLTDRMFRTVSQAPAHLTVIALALTGLAVLAVKAFTRGGTFMRGGWPSGHTAIASAGAIAIGFATHSAAATVLALFLAALVAQSRVEAEIHTIPQVILGGLLGILVAALVFQVFFV